MAYTSAPVASTYSTERLAVAYGIETPDFTTFVAPLNRDAGMVNLLPKKTINPKTATEEFYVETRPPIAAQVLETSAAFTRGVYVWQKTDTATYYFAVVGVKVYTSTDGLTWTAVTTLLTNVTTPVGFTEFIDNTNTKKLILVDGVEGYVFTSNAAGTKIVDVDFPTPHTPYPIFIDGYIFLSKKDTGDIYNSDLNNPASWTAGNFISSELYPDNVVALVKVNNYLLAVGAQGCEYFYDAANATGSPLARYEGASLPFGSSVPYSIASNKNTVVMLANNNDGELTIKFIEDFKHQDITPTWLLPLLNINFSNSTITVDSIRGYFLRWGGELYYALRIGAGNISYINFPTFVYSFSTKMWVEFKTDQNGFTVTCSCSGSSNDTISFVGGNYIYANPNALPFFGTFGISKLYNASGNYITTQSKDQILTGATVTYGPSIYTELRTTSYSFGTLNNKTQSRFGLAVKLWQDSLGASLSLYTTDDDWTTLSTARSLDVKAGTNFPFVTQLGSFRQRSYKITYQGLTWMKYLFIEVDINKGQQ